MISQGGGGEDGYSQSIMKGMSLWPQGQEKTFWHLFPNFQRGRREEEIFFACFPAQWMPLLEQSPKEGKCDYVFGLLVVLL